MKWMWLSSGFAMLLLERGSLTYSSIINHLNNLSPGRQDSFVRPEPAGKQVFRTGNSAENINMNFIYQSYSV